MVFHFHILVGLGSTANRKKKKSPSQPAGELYQISDSCITDQHELSVSAFKPLSAMTPHLHPRSRLTTSLFGTTLLVSFLVVGMPHILPCPAPRVKFADSEFEVTEDGRRRRRRRRTTEPLMDETTEVDSGKQTPLYISEEERAIMRKKAHECPVPKPPGIIGRILGFQDEDSREEQPASQITKQNATEVRENNP